MWKIGILLCVVLTVSVDQTFGEMSENEKLKYYSELYYSNEIADLKLKNASIGGIMNYIVVDVQSIDRKAKDIVTTVNKTLETCGLTDTVDYYNIIVEKSRTFLSDVERCLKDLQQGAEQNVDIIVQRLNALENRIIDYRNRFRGCSHDYNRPVQIHWEYDCMYHTKLWTFPLINSARNTLYDVEGDSTKNLRAILLDVNAASCLSHHTSYRTEITDLFDKISICKTDGLLTDPLVATAAPTNP